jgi:hypothetical protein
MNKDKLTDDINKHFEDTGRGSHAIRITDTSTTDDQVECTETPKDTTVYTINLVKVEWYKNKLDKQSHSVEEVQKPSGRSKWARDTRLIHKIILLEKELGPSLTHLDLLCRFDRRELDSVSDILHWLL